MRNGEQSREHLLKGSWFVSPLRSREDLGETWWEGKKDSGNRGCLDSSDKVRFTECQPCSKMTSRRNVRLGHTLLFLEYSMSYNYPEA